MLLLVGLGVLLIGVVGGVMWLGGSVCVSMYWFGLVVLGLVVVGWLLWCWYCGGSLL